MTISVVILAAGEGTRMRSDLPKVLHCLGGKALLAHVIEAAQSLQPKNIYVVVGHKGEAVQKALAHLPVQWIEQAQQLGTGHAVAQAMPHVQQPGVVVVLYGDVPLVNSVTLRELVEKAKQSSIALVTAKLDNPTGYGRIVRGPNERILRIVEEKDASAEIREIVEVNTGILAANAEKLANWLAKLRNDNAQGEYYLTDVIAQAVADDLTVDSVFPNSNAEILGVNNRVQLAEVERHFQRQNAERLMIQGTTLLDPARFDQRGTFHAGKDVIIDINVVLEGNVVCGDRVQIGPNSVIRNATIGNDVRILANCVIEDAIIGAGSRIGPFARLRPETVLAENVHLGNFVEIKKSTVGRDSNINHLSYVGDATVGSCVNIGAGTITCNYDGANKHRTIIGDGAFIGSDTQLVAPIEVGAEATVGAGSTITRDVPPGGLTLSRIPQKSVPHWKRPQKKPKT